MMCIKLARVGLIGGRLVGVLLTYIATARLRVACMFVTLTDRPLAVWHVLLLATFPISGGSLMNFIISQLI